MYMYATMYAGVHVYVCGCVGVCVSVYTYELIYYNVLYIWGILLRYGGGGGGTVVSVYIFLFFMFCFSMIFCNKIFLYNKKIISSDHSDEND